MSDMDRAFEWDDEIVEDSQQIEVLPAGDYDFKVVDMERAYYDGGAKLPPCKEAKLKLEIQSADGKTGIVRHNIFLHSKCEWQLSAFFCAIGQKKRNEPLKMNWNQVIGATGRAKIGIRKYEDKDYNEVKRFYDKEQGASSYTMGAF